MFETYFKGKSQFESDKEGVLFIGQSGKNEIDFDVEAMWFIDQVVTSYKIFCKEGIELESDMKVKQFHAHLYLQLEKSIKECEVYAHEHPEAATLHGFNAVKNNEKDFAPYASTGIIKLPMLPDAINVFMQHWNEDRLDNKQHNKLVQRILPYATCCDSVSEEIVKRIPALIEYAIRCITLDGKDDNFEFPCPYAMSLSVRSNEALENAKSEIEDKFYSFISQYSKEFVHDASLATLSPHDYGPKTTAGFHITVVGDQTYLGMLVNPDKRKGYYT